MKILTLENISKSFGNKKIIDNFSYEFEKGEMVGILGKSGSGKTTLLNIIGLLEEKDNGTIKFYDKNINKINTSYSNKIIREKIAYLFQNYALIDTENVKENIKIGLKYRKDLKNNEINTEIKNLLYEVGLEGYENRYIYSLSGGEQQRVALARIIGKPNEIILADEPTGNLDESNKEIVMNILKREKKKGKTIIMVTHDKSLLSYFDRVIELK